MSRLLAVLVFITFCAVTFGEEDFFATRLKEIRPGYIWECRQNPVDIMFVVDASNSIWSANFTLGLEFIHDFLKRYDIAPNKAHVAAVLFSEGVFPSESFGLTNYTNKEELLEAVLSLSYVGGYRTDTGLGIRYMRKITMQEARKDVPHIAIVLTDGQSQDKKLTALEAALARSQGIMMFSIGVGLHVSFQELINIAGNPDNAFSVHNYEALQSIKDKLEYRTCIEKLGPTPPPPPPCGERNPSNIIFIFDMFALSETALEAVQSFMSEVIHHMDTEIGMQYGVSSGTCPDDAGVSLGQYENPDVLVERLAPGTQNRMVSLLNQANTMFTNGRSETSQYAVVFYERSVNVTDAIGQFNTAFSGNVQITMVVIEQESPPLSSVFDNVRLVSGEDLSELGQQFVEQLCNEAGPMEGAETGAETGAEATE